MKDLNTITRWDQFNPNVPFKLQIYRYMYLCPTDYYINLHQELEHIKLNLKAAKNKSGDHRKIFKKNFPLSVIIFGEKMRGMFVTG